MFVREREVRALEMEVVDNLQMICDRFPPKDFKQGSDKIRCVFWKNKI